MLAKVLSAFLAVQLTFFALWQGTEAWGKTALSAEKPAILAHEEPDTLHAVSHVHFSARSTNNDFGQLDPLKEKELTTVLGKLPADHFATLSHLVLDYDPNAHRGLGGKNLIILRTVNMGHEEFVGVLIHEIGHNVDLGHLNDPTESVASEFKDGKQPIYAADPSAAFYRISWTDEATRKPSAGNLDFVSGYAMSDPFEDFAETYVYYVLHNRDFKSKTQTSELLLAKYNFMKKTVFDGKEFDTGTYLSDHLNRRPWDITLLPYDLEGFLAR